VGFEQERISVGSIIFLFQEKASEQELYFRAGNRWVFEGFALFISGTYFPSYSPKQFSPRSLWFVFFSHWRFIVYWFDARVIFQHPSIDFRRSGALSTRYHPLPALATRSDILRSSTVVHCHR
jgi:hypothetical protein